MSDFIVKGFRYGTWTVESFDHNSVTYVCDCGTRKTERKHQFRYAVRNGKRKTCHVCNLKSRRKFDDITVEMSYGSWTVTKVDWPNVELECDCGQPKIMELRQFRESIKKGILTHCNSCAQVLKRKHHLLPGDTFGKWTVVKEIESAQYWNPNYGRYFSLRLFLCKCECGVLKEVPLNHLVTGRSQQCHKCGAQTNNGAKKHPLYQTWRGMIDRCENPESRNGRNYGQRGIKVCQRWRDDFWAFVEDMGERLEGYSLDRIDFNGDYEPSNCRWADLKTQNNNRSNVKMITYNGKTQCVSDWAKEMGMSVNGLHDRLNAGWTIEEALTRKPNRRSRKYD